MMKELKRFQVIRRIEKEDVEKRLEKSTSAREEAAGRYASAKNLDDLKKQSQLLPELIGATSYIKGDYNNNPAGGDKENKAKQSQFQPRFKEREKAGAGNLAVLK